MDENAESATENVFPNLVDMVCDAIVWRVKQGKRFADGEVDLLLALSSEETDRILDELNDDECLKLAGIMRDRKEAITARFQKACRDGA